MVDTVMMWFRRDLRLADNAALTEAVAQGGRVLCATTVAQDVGPNATRDAWMHASRAALAEELRSRGGDLVVRAGEPAHEIADMCRTTGARTVFCTRDWTPAGMREERHVADALQASGCTLSVHGGSVLVEPDELRTGKGNPYRVFTPFLRAWKRAWVPHAPLPAPARVSAPLGMADLLSAQPVDTVRGNDRERLRRWWAIGEAGAAERLTEFVDDDLDSYADLRDRPDLRGTSEASPRLATGELSPLQVAWAASEAGAAAEPLLRQLAWRDFAYHVLHHSPETEFEPLRPEFSAMPWREDPDAFDAWRSGRTGYPLVDAGMRQLLATGWMHNRARLVCGSFLAKDLLIDWREGEAFFRKRLADYDTASNVFNWQWVSGCGADAAPYFRIFNPIIQGARFDPEGEYVRRWVPELGGLSSRWVHAPWGAPEEELEEADVALGDTYPRPIVDHFEARDRALAALQAIKASRADGGTA